MRRRSVVVIAAVLLAGAVAVPVLPLLELMAEGILAWPTAAVELVASGPWISPLGVALPFLG